MGKLTDKEVIEEALIMALKKGMSPSVIDEGTFYQIYARIKTRNGETFHPTGLSPKDCYGFFFNHEFAKAFWGVGKRVFDKFIGDGYELPIEEGTCSIIKIPLWQYHLQQMVLFENPIDYLRKFIEK